MTKKVSAQRITVLPEGGRRKPSGQYKDWLDRPVIHDPEVPSVARPDKKNKKEKK